MDENKLLRLEDAAAYLRVGVRRVRELVAAGALPVLVIGPRSRRIPAAALRRWALERAGAIRQA